MEIEIRHIGGRRYKVHDPGTPSEIWQGWPEVPESPYCVDPKAMIRLSAIAHEMGVLAPMRQHFRKTFERYVRGEDLEETPSEIFRTDSQIFLESRYW